MIQGVPEVYDTLCHSRKTFKCLQNLQSLESLESFQELLDTTRNFFYGFQSSKRHQKQERKTVKRISNNSSIFVQEKLDCATWYSETK